jgi:probable HAF family extracellular repeat protein
MIINNCFKIRNLILTAFLITSLCPANHASALGRSFLIDLNSKTVTEIGTSDGIYNEVYDINDAGQVVGYSGNSEGVTHAFITGPNGMGIRALGTLDGDYSQAYGINNAGQVVG